MRPRPWPGSLREKDGVQTVHLLGAQSVCPILVRFVQNHYAFGIADLELAADSSLLAINATVRPGGPLVDPFFTPQVQASTSAGCTRTHIAIDKDPRAFTLPREPAS